MESAAVLLEQARALSQSCLAVHDYESASWYADKACSLGGGSEEDLLALANVYTAAGQLERALTVLEHHSLIDFEQQANPARAQRGLVQTAANSGRARAEGHGFVPAAYAGAMKPASLPYFHLAAVCLVGLGRHEVAVQLLEGCMEGRGRPGLRVPLKPVPPAVALAPAAFPAAQGVPTSSGVGGLKAAGLSSPMSSRALFRSDKENAGAGGAEERAAWVPAVGLDGPMSADEEAALLSGLQPGDDGMGVRSGGGRSLGSRRGSQGVRGAVGAVEGVAVWHIIRHMALQHSEQVAAAAAVAAGAPAAGCPTLVIPLSLLASEHVPVGSGTRINLVATLCLLRGRALLALDNRLRAAQWFVAALRCDPYCASALHALVDNALLTGGEEERLRVYLASVLAPAAAEATAAAGRVVLVAEHPRAAATALVAALLPSRPAAPHATAGAVPATLTRVRSGRNVLAGVPKAPAPPAPLTGARAAGSRSASITSEHDAMGGGSDTESERGGSGAGAAVLPPVAVRLSTAWALELYAVRLNRYALTPSVQERFAALETGFGTGLGTAGRGRVQACIDVQASKAEVLHAQQDYEGAHALTSRLLAVDPGHSRAALVHYNCLVILKRPPELFAAAHAAVASAPRFALSWYAVGCYYVCLGRLASAARHFLHATELDASFAPAWAGLGLAYAGQEELEPALAAYRTAMRLAPNAHAPPLAIAALCCKAGSYALALQYIDMALASCAHDPAVYHEAGVLEWRQGLNAVATGAASGEGSLAAALGLWETAAQLVAVLSVNTQRAHEATFSCLGHAYRKQGRWGAALSAYGTALSLSPGKPSILAAMAFTHQLAGRPGKAAELYHSVLAQVTDDAFCNKMLRTALADIVEAPFQGVGRGEVADALPPRQGAAAAASPPTPASRALHGALGHSRVLSELDEEEEEEDAGAFGRAGGADGGSDGDMDMGLGFEEEEEEEAAVYTDLRLDADGYISGRGEGERPNAATPVEAGPPPPPPNALPRRRAAVTPDMPPSRGTGAGAGLPFAVSPAAAMMDFSTIVSPVLTSEAWDAGSPSAPGSGAGALRSAGAAAAVAAAAEEEEEDVEMELDDEEMAARLQAEEYAAMAAGMGVEAPDADAAAAAAGMSRAEYDELCESGVFAEDDFGDD
jgi:tetratricopeptide (TPR) repeat protein